MAVNGGNGILAIRRRRKLFSVCQALELTKDERIELACYLLRRDIQSYADLSDEQVLRLLDAFEGHHLINELLAQRPPGAEPGGVGGSSPPAGSGS